MGFVAEERAELVEGWGDLAGLVVPERGVVPVLGDLCRACVAILVGFHPPPEESCDVAVLLQGLDEGLGESLLPCLADGIGGGEVDAWGADGGLPVVEIACLDNHYLLVGKLVFELRQAGIERVEIAVVVGIIAGADDVVIDIGRQHLLIEIGQRAGVGNPLGVENDFCIRTDLTAGLPCLLQQVGEAWPVGCIAVVAAVGFGALSSPEHAVADFVARLDEIGRGACCDELLEAVFGVVVDFLGEFAVREPEPGFRRPLLGGVCP